MDLGKCDSCGSEFFYLVDATKHHLYHDIHRDMSIPYYSAKVFGRGKLAFCASCGKIIFKHNGIDEALIEKEEPTNRDME